MKRFFVISLITLLLVCSMLVSCNHETIIDDDSVSDGATLIAGGVSLNLSSLNDGEEKLFRFENGINGTLYLDGATIDSLYVIEKQTNSKAIDSSRAVDGKLANNNAASDLFLVLPQEDGKLSFSGVDIGITTSGQFSIKRLGNNANTIRTESGSTIFQYKIENTLFNYRENGFPEFLWPSYLNYYIMNLNDPTWAAYKNQKVVVGQTFITYVDAPGGSETGDHFGLIDIGTITYDSDKSIHGLYDLSGKNCLNIYSFLRTAFAENVDFRFETFILLPDEIEEGGAPLTIGDLPRAIIFRDDFTKEKAYIVSYKDVPADEKNHLLIDIVESCLGIRGGTVKICEHNGDTLFHSAYVKNVTKHGELYDIDMYLSGIDEEFVMKTMMTQYEPFDDYGEISFVETDDVTWAQDNSIDLSDHSEHSRVLDAGESLSIVWKVPEGDHKLYKLTVCSEKDGLAIESNWVEGKTKNSGSRSMGTDEILISNAECPDGFCFVLSNEDGNSITWQVEELEWEENPSRKLDKIEFWGKITAQRELSAINPTEGVVVAYYNDGTVADVTLAPGLSCTTETGEQNWGPYMKRSGNPTSWFCDEDKHRVIFTYTENGVTKETQSNNFRLFGLYGENTYDSIHEFQNTAGSYIVLGTNAIQDGLHDPIVVEDPNPENWGGFLFNNDDACDAGDNAIMFFSYDDYLNDSCVDGEDFGGLLLSVGAQLEETDDAPGFDWRINNGLFNLTFSISGEGSPMEIVVVYGKLKNAVSPVTGIRKSDFYDGAKTFFIRTTP